MLVAKANSTTHYLGTVEALGQNRTIHTIQSGNHLDTYNTFSKLNTPEDEKARAVNFSVDFIRTLDNQHLSVTDKKLATIHDIRVYYIDEDCSLAFSGPKEHNIENAMFRCRY